MSDRRFLLTVALWLNLTIILVTVTTPTWLRISTIIAWAVLWVLLWVHSDKGRSANRPPAEGPSGGAGDSGAARR